MAKKDTDSSIYEGVTGKKPASTAKSRQLDIEAQMEGFANDAERQAAKRGNTIKRPT